MFYQDGLLKGGAFDGRCAVAVRIFLEPIPKPPPREGTRSTGMNHKNGVGSVPRPGVK